MSFYRMLGGALVAAALSAKGYSAAPTGLQGANTTSRHGGSVHQIATATAPPPVQSTTPREAVPTMQHPRRSRPATGRLLPSEEYPDCYGFTASMGTGRCTPANNNKECGFDGGDCCECTCVDSLDHVCGSHGYDCRDPGAACEFAAGSQGLSSARRSAVIGMLGAVFACCVAVALLVIPI